MAEQRSAKNWVGGDWGSAGVEKPSTNPATGTVFGTYRDGGAEVASSAIAAAVAAYTPKAWRADPMLRTMALSHMADAYAARLGEVIDTLCLENGKRGRRLRLRPASSSGRFALLRVLQRIRSDGPPTPSRAADDCAAPGYGRRGADHPVELAGLPWDSRAGAGLGRGLHNGDEVSGTGRPQCAPCRRDHEQRPGIAARRGKHFQRIPRGWSAAAG